MYYLATMHTASQSDGTVALKCHHFPKQLPRNPQHKQFSQGLPRTHNTTVNPKAITQQLPCNPGVQSYQSYMSWGSCCVVADGQADDITSIDDHTAAVRFAEKSAKTL